MSTSQQAESSGRRAGLRPRGPKVDYVYKDDPLGNQAQKTEVQAHAPKAPSQSPTAQAQSPEGEAQRPGGQAQDENVAEAVPVPAEEPAIPAKPTPEELEQQAVEASTDSDGVVDLLKKADFYLVRGLFRVEDCKELDEGKQFVAQMRRKDFAMDKIRKEAAKDKERIQKRLANKARYAPRRTIRRKRALAAQ